MRISLEEAIFLLKQGEVVAIPTETVYGLAADATNPDALKKIYTTKERPQTNPLIVHIAEISQVEDWVTVFPPLAQKIAHAFWPGPLTLVLDAKPEVSRILTAGHSTVALRVPNHVVALDLLKKSGLALAAPSANKYTQLSPTTAAHVEAGLGAEIPVIDGGACKVGIESSIVQVFKGEDGNWHWRLLRKGMISAAQIAAVTQTAEANENQTAIPKIQVPGQHHLHYSPRTPLALVKDKKTLKQKIEACLSEHKSCAALMFEQTFAQASWPCEVKTLPESAAIYAEHLYAVLHTLDTYHVDQLFIESPPQAAEWYPILDRLQRAAHH
jgi:L-threonylcarbamoyladenylate synthase